MIRRVVPDIQALVQGVLSRSGPAGVLLESWERRETKIITCEEIVSTLEAVLMRPHIRRKFANLSADAVLTVAAGLREQTVFVDPDDVPRVVTDDPDDDIVLACAVAGHADYVISPDRHLLALGSYQGVPIVSSETFARILRGHVSEPLEFVYGRRG